MNKQPLKSFALSLVMIVASTTAFAAAASDIAGLAARRETVAMALSLIEPAPISPLPDEIVNLFNPVAFGQPDAEELAAIAAARAAEAAASAKAKPTSDTDLLELIAQRVVPSGTVTLNGEPLLIFGQKRLRVGDRLTVTYDGRDYTIELTAIQRFTFTLRLNRAEITRRINP